ncbi:MAG: hypothetical protein ABL901_12840 [Hyphomicrobiaceae bacterium]
MSSSRTCRVAGPAMVWVWDVELQSEMRVERYLKGVEALRRVRVVQSFEELVGARFEGDVNALCWARELAGDFREVAAALSAGEGMTAIEDEDLRALALSPAGAVARDVLLLDQALLRGAGLEPMLEVNTGYPRDEAAGPIPTDVYSFHADSATVSADTYLCTYMGRSSEGVLNEEVVRRADIAETRAQLLKRYGGADDAGFAAYLSEQHYDLHYWPQPGARPYSFGLGNLWRIAIAYPGCPVLPCIHRAPLTLPGYEARLLLIS